MPERFNCSVRFKVQPDPTREYVQVGDASGMWCLVPCEFLGHYNEGGPEWMPNVVMEALNLLDASRKLAPKVAKDLER